MFSQSSRNTVVSRLGHRSGARRTQSVLLTVLILVGVVGSMPAACLAQGAIPSERVSSTDPVVAVCQQIYRGQFATAERLVESAANRSDPRMAYLQSLITDYEAIGQRRDVARAEAFDEQIAELDKLKASMDLDAIARTPVDVEMLTDPNYEPGPDEPNTVTEALAVVRLAVEFASEAQKTALMADPFVKKLIQVSVDQSSAFEEKGKWLDAYTRFYYWLQSIDPDNTGYTEYADELIDKATIAASFQDSPCETRKERYAGIEVRMFKRAMDALDLRYVNSIDYVKMATESLKRCSFLAEVLAVAFPEGLESENGGSAFEVPTKAEVAAWNAALAGLRDEVEAAAGDFDKERFLDMMDHVLDLDDATVQLPRRALIAHFSEAALGTLDPYTVMVWPRQVTEFEQLMLNEFSGIGAEISKPAGLLTVASLLPDTPAYRSGLDAGDVIETVNGVPTRDMSLTCAVQKIKGPQGTSVVLGVRRRGQEELDKVTIVRDRIIVPTIRGWQRTEDGDWLHMVDETNRIGYVRITSFAAETAGDLEDVLRQLEADGLNGLILDLRDNTGGLLDSAVNIVDKFIEDGLIVSTRPKQGLQPAFEFAHRGGTHPDYPLVILTNSGSASASEIVAGALGDGQYERAVLVGDRTHGKGSVQGIISYPGGGSQLKYTMAYYHLPSGQRVKSRDAEEEAGREDWGVGTDVVVKLNSDERSTMLDIQRDNDVLVQAGRNDHSADVEKHTLAETLDSDPQLAVGLLVVKAKLIESRMLVAMN